MLQVWHTRWMCLSPSVSVVAGEIGKQDPGVQCGREVGHTGDRRRSRKVTQKCRYIIADN